MERSLVYKGGGHMKKSGFLLLAVVSLFSLSMGPFVADTLATSEIIFKPGPGKNDGSDSGSVNGGKDTLVSRFNDGVNDYRNKNFGSETSITGSPRSNCNPSDVKAYIQFDLSSLPADVQQVFLGVTHIPHTTNCYSNCNADFYFYPVSQSWNEMILTYNTMPLEGAALYGPINITFPNNFGTREYDITNIYKNWKNGSVPNYGLAIYSPTVGCNNAAVVFNVHSSDDSDQTVRPYLKILSSSPPPPTSSLSDTGWKISGNFTASIKFPNLVELSVKLPKLETYWNSFGAGEMFYFQGDGTFEDLLLSLLPMLAGNTGIDIPPPTWSQNGLNFIVDVTDFSNAVADALQSVLGNLATVNPESTKDPSFTGKVDSKGASISGKLAIYYNLSIALGSGSPVDGTLSLTMSFKGIPLQSGVTAARAAFESTSWSLASKANSEGALRFSSAIKNMLSEIKALVPPKEINLLKSH
jgi:hypothetical protein